MLTGEPVPVAGESRTSLWAAWTLVVLFSAVPAIVSAELTGVVPSWLPIAQLALSIVVLLASAFVPALEPLRRFAIVMGLLVMLWQALPLLDLTFIPLQQLFGATAFDDRMQAEQSGKVVATLAIIGALLLLGFRRREIFLTPGRLTAPIRPVRVLGFPRADSWRRFGLVWGFGIAAGLAVVQYLFVRPSASDLLAIVPMIPSILFYAAVNAFTEEMTYRAPMLATLEPAVGSRQALWMSAGLFGIAHYFGTPGGLSGAALSVFMGYILSKAMIETRGLFWPWFIHALSDVVIFSFLALALTGPATLSPD